MHWHHQTTQGGAESASEPDDQLPAAPPGRGFVCFEWGTAYPYQHGLCILRKKGAYTEDDVSDAEDIYGRTKFLGELHEPHCLTLRTSIIGRELETKSGLIEWFLGQQGRAIKGYRRASYTGLTTLVLARVIENVLVKHPDLAGLWQVSSDRISKYELLCLARDAFRWRGEISPDDSFVCDRSLDSSRFRRATGFVAPGWTTMLDELARAPK